jgi:hypothetical protein
LQSIYQPSWANWNLSHRRKTWQLLSWLPARQAQEYSKALGRTITYQDIPVGPWRDALLARGLPAHLVHHLPTMADLHRAGRYDRMSDDVLMITGQQPLSVREVVKRNSAIFTPSAKENLVNA